MEGALWMGLPVGRHSPVVAHVRLVLLKMQGSPFFY